MSLLACWHIPCRLKVPSWASIELPKPCKQKASLAKYYLPVWGHKVGTCNRLPPNRMKALGKSSEQMGTAKGQDLSASLLAKENIMFPKGVHDAPGRMHTASQKTENRGKDRPKWEAGPSSGKARVECISGGEKNPSILMMEKQPMQTSSISCFL